MDITALKRKLEQKFKRNRPITNGLLEDKKKGKNWQRNASGRSHAYLSYRALHGNILRNVDLDTTGDIHTVVYIWLTVFRCYNLKDSHLSLL
jgi:hypothetical protein